MHLEASCNASLKRLKTDVIDLYHVHEWDGQTPIEETVEAEGQRTLFWRD